MVLLLLLLLLPAPPWERGVVVRAISQKWENWVIVFVVVGEGVGVGVGVDIPTGEGALGTERNGAGDPVLVF